MFNIQQYIDKQKIPVNKLINHLKNKGILFSEDLECNNIIFTSKDKIMKMSKHSFYRYSGIHCVVTEKTKESVETTIVTDEMWLQSYIKPIIENYFK